MKTRLLLALALAVIGGVWMGAVAQVTLPTLQYASPTDLIQDIPGGQPSSASKYVHPAQISGVAGYSNGGVAVTAFTHTYGAGEQYFFINPAGTLATGTITTEAHPGDGQRECFFSTKTQTALTWTANTGQSLDTTVPTAGVANTLQCILYSAATATWYRVQ